MVRMHSKFYTTAYWFCILMIAFLLSVRMAAGDERSIPLPVRVGLVDVAAASGGRRGSTEFTALRRIFEGLGIPFDLLFETSRLQNYRMVCTGGALLNSVLSSNVVNDLYDYVEDGGTLVAAGEIGNVMYPLFSVEGQKPGRSRYRMSFAGGDASLRYIDHPNERTISLGNGEALFYDEVIWSHGYELSDDALALGRFDDGWAGFLLHRYGRGRAYLLGLSYTESVLLPQIGKDYEAQRRFANVFEPSGDVIMLILKAIYESSVSPFLYLSAVPYALPTALILSHDVDAQTSFVDSLKFAALEERYGVKSTFFENTKYFTDSMDIGYYAIEENKEAIRKLKGGRWDIGSHTVSHYKQFSKVPEGDSGVTFKTYDPQKSITVYGEVRVSKELLDRDIPGQNTVAFRAGNLQFPNSLIRILEEEGYLYDSTFSSGDVLTSFPYFALRERNQSSRESKVIEIPVALDDSLGFLTPERVEVAVREWSDIVSANLRNEAITVLLMHPSDTRERSYKLDAQERLMKAVIGFGGWIGDLTAFGEFWRARHAAGFSAFIENDTLVIEIKGKQADLHPAVGFVMGNTKLKKVLVKDSSGQVLPFRVVERDGKLYVGRKWKTGR